MLSAVSTGRLSAQTQWDLAVDRVLVSAAAGATTGLGEILAAAVSDNRQVALASFQPVAVLLAGEGGAVRQVGRIGSGPGEYRSATAVGFPADTVWVLDPTLGRFSFFDTTGRFLRSVTIPTALERDARGRNARLVPFSWLRDGSVAYHVSAVAQPPGPGADPIPIAIGDAQGRIRDTVAMIGPYIGADYADPSGRARRVRVPFAFGTSFAVSPDGASFVTVEQTQAKTATAARFTVTRRTLDGRQVARATIPYQPERIPDAVRQRHLASSGFAPGTQGHRVLRGLLDEIGFFPAATVWFVALDGATWIARGTADSVRTHWLIVGPAGQPIGQLTVPRAVQIRQADATFAWAVQYSREREPEVLRYRILR
jgi:hypothetical protein